MSASQDAVATLARIQEASFARAAEATRNAFPSERRMDGATLASFLARKNQGVFATVRTDGRPHAAPAGYALVGARFVIASLAGAARVANIRHEPHCSLVVMEGEDDDHAVVIVEGTARLVAPMDAPLEMRAPFRESDGTLPPWVGTLVVVTPERLLSYAAEGFPG
jgi:nitroimidazol reductase NimA-like FMN-containing flavoprotein (pyridoxamine 5'-phosphate oxidase superfamily)